MELHRIGLLRRRRSRQIPFLAQKMYTGPVTDMLGGADISWLVGIVFTG